MVLLLFEASHEVLAGQKGGERGHAASGGAIRSARQLAGHDLIAHQYWAAIELHQKRNLACKLPAEANAWWLSLSRSLQVFRQLQAVHTRTYKAHMW